MKQEEETSPIQESNNSVPDNSGTATKPKKARKPYEWTAKRKEAFDKMRKGLEEKVSLTKRIKDEKKRSEKDAIKAKVKEIMNSKKGVVVTQESDSSSDSSSSEEEKAPRRKKSSSEKKPMKDTSNRSKIEKRKSRREESSEEEQNEQNGASSSEEEKPRREQEHFTQKQHLHYQKDKVDRGKAVKVAQFVNPLDRFILL
jgi:hypothetical protein